MPVLEKTFPHVQSAAIPAVAVPLLQDDCIDTTVDVDWVWDYIHLEAADRSRRLDLGGLHDRVKGWFERPALDALMGPPVGHAEEVGRDWLAVGGRRWRPFLAAAVCEALSGTAGDDTTDGAAGSDDAVRRIAVAVECFHKASLVHDDIEDGDLERYGQPTLAGAHGVPVALNVGDLLIGEGYRLLAESGLDADGVRAAVREAAASQRLLCRGQGAELAWRQAPTALASRQVLEIFRLKTSPAFDVALQLAAIAAGRHAEVTDVLRSFSESVGIAYQIKDDLEDLLDDAGLTAEAASRPSVVMALATERARGADREMLASLASGRPHPAATAEALREAIRSTKADERAALLLEGYKEQAVRALEGLADPTLKGLLRRVLAKMFNELTFAGYCREQEAKAARSERAEGSAAGAETPAAASTAGA
jgi:geranylgeranyl pyrophosphate synthase